MAERPSLLEIGGVLLACAALLVTLARLDESAAKRHQARAAAAIAAAAKAPPAGPAAAVVATAARVEQVGARQLILLPARRAWASGLGAPGVRSREAPSDLERVPGPAAHGRLHTRATALGWLALVALAGLGMAAAGGRLLSRRWA